MGVVESQGPMSMAERWLRIERNAEKAEKMANTLSPPPPSGCSEGEYAAWAGLWNRHYHREADKLCHAQGLRTQAYQVGYTAPPKPLPLVDEETMREDLARGSTLELGF